MVIVGGMTATQVVRRFYWRDGRHLTLGLNIVLLVYYIIQQTNQLLLQWFWS